MQTMTLTVPIRTVSGMNVREHYMARAKRVKRERYAVGVMLNGHKAPTLPVVVMMGRLSRGHVPLDDDNLQAALKPTRDEVARWLGVDDADHGVIWRYTQKCSMPAWGVAIVVGW